ncbi:YabP/YqfC family sporulation protein [uncultured Merdimonas sp.]|uniref:YabP/YqfC family sporulation protein n=1 Tax=uncultured Merdimonas sp. TaxID=2023269 RepID=UPI00320AE8F1
MIMRQKEADHRNSKIAEWAEIPKDITPGVPVLTITGHSELRLENYRGILEYTDTLIRVVICDGFLHIGGENIQIRSYGEYEMTVFGKITSVLYLRREDI